MAAQQSRDTLIELTVRRHLHGFGLRYRVHRSVVPGTRRVVDIVFGPARVAVDVRGCFWHGCPEHFRPPPNNTEWWTAKIDKNALRDRDTALRLAAAGWQHVVVWEHDDLEDAAARIAALVRERRR